MKLSFMEKLTAAAMGMDKVNGTGTDENGNDFTFTPVPIISRLGDNTMWGDGDLSVIYRRDIDLALAQ